jgi:hypothetical protein
MHGYELAYAGFCAVNGTIAGIPEERICLLAKKKNERFGNFIGAAFFSFP